MANKVKITKWDIQNFLKTEADIAAYLEAAFDDGDPAIIAAALGDVAKARGMAKVSKASGLNRAHLYTSLSADGNPELRTMVGVLKACGLKLTIAAAYTGHGEEESIGGNLCANFVQKR